MWLPAVPARTRPKQAIEELQADEELRQMERDLELEDIWDDDISSDKYNFVN